MALDRTLSLNVLLTVFLFSEILVLSSDLTKNRCCMSPPVPMCSLEISNFRIVFVYVCVDFLIRK